MHVKSLFITIVGLVVIGMVTASAEPNTIPEWVKNNAKWWADGTIGDDDFINSMQYLISQDILSVPITSVVAADTIVDEERAMSLVVHYNGEVFKQGHTIYTYSEFQQINNPVKTVGGGLNPSSLPFHHEGSGLSLETQSTAQTFYLAGVPSLDKKQVYELVAQYINPGRPPAEYNVAIDIVAGNGEVIQTWTYDKCHITYYVPYVDSSKDEHRFSDLDESEIREIMVWKCGSIKLQV